MQKKGILVVVSGFSGVGKGTVVRRLVSDYDCYALSVSATTRAPRDGELDGREYFFKTKEEFEKMVAEDAFLEYACYVENSYGTPKHYVEEQLAAGKNVILEIEIQGALKIKEKYPEAMLIFVVPPSAEALKQRLIGRGTESMEVVEKRLARAVEESEGIEKYDYVIENDDLDTCVRELHEMIASERGRVFRNLQNIEELQKEIGMFSMNS